ncbi:putative membrane protein YccC [Paenarthrobacter nicotinovorans]|uniref:FUSC family protein n=1 Tax=Micrococcaceae TaxID=1268 RepID=UPI000876B884|nr:MULTISPECIES: FUSC family protein [Micrococcaceae]MDR6437585.1 putative membrane protein YccC [Paenarthrobacter nicotinovorans]SCZ60790.1 Fusaric acid resistance protein-like [Arthrobacter sp. UNCCL28]
MPAIITHARELHRLGPANNDRLSAVRVALSVAVPGLFLILIGRPDLMMYAVFGALTGMYGRNETHQLRLKHQAQAALLLVGGLGIGVVLSVNHIHSWWLVLIATVFAGAGSLYADAVRLKPIGPFFGILALGACASVPTSVPPTTAVLIGAASAAFSLVVGFAGWFRYRKWESGAARDVPVLRGPRRQAAFVQAALVHAARYSLAVSAAGTIGVLSGSGHPHWAMAAAAVPLAGADLPSRVHRGIHRIVGTFLGLAVVAVVLFPSPLSPLQYFPGQTAVVLAVLVVLCQFPTELFMARHYGWAMVFFTPVILLIAQLAAPMDPGVLVMERAIETFVGAVVGIAVAVLVRARRVPQ